MVWLIHIGLKKIFSNFFVLNLLSFELKKTTFSDDRFYNNDYLHLMQKVFIEKIS